jgi:hypothetical protein
LRSRSRKDSHHYGITVTAIGIALQYAAAGETWEPVQPEPQGIA